MTPSPPPEILRVLDRHDDATWRYESELPLQSIDLIASVTNNARFEAIDAPTVDRYSAALQDGATFPPVLVRQVTGKDRKLVNLGGNHRTRAHIDAGRKTIAAFVVICDDLAALELAYADNATHGLPPTEQERLAHCLVLIDRGRTAAEAARVVGISDQKLYRHLTTRSVEKRAADLGVTAELVDVGIGIRPRLASIDEDRLFVKVIRTVSAERMGQHATAQLIGDVNAQPDVASAMDIIQLHVRDHRARVQGRTVGRPATNPYTVLRTTLGTIRGLNAADVVDRAGTHAERVRLAELCMAGARHLKAIHDLAKVADQ